MTKILSVLLSAVILFTSLTPSYAQAVEGERRSSAQRASIREMLKGYKPRIETALPSDNTRVVRPVAEREVVLRKAGRGTGRAVAVTRADVSRAIEEAVAEAAVERDGVSKGVAKLEEVLAAERKAAEEWRRRGGASIGPAQSSRERYIGVLPRLNFLYEGEVFGEGEYHGLKLSKRDWAWAGLRLDLKGMKGRVPEYEVESGWNSQLGRSEYVAGGDVIGNSVQIVKALKEYGVSEADKDLAREELAGMLKVKGLCEDKRGGIKIGDVDGKNVRGDYEYNLRTVPLCQFSLDVMEGLGVLAVQHKDKKAVDEIYNYMVAKHREGLGPMVVYQGAALLMGIDSQYSYGKLKEFLKERAHQTTGGKILSSLSYLSFEGLSRGVQEGSSEGKHLNGYTARYGYLDRETAEGYNPNLAIDIVTAQPLTSDGKYQLPMGNVYEDIGAMLAADAMKNGKSAALATDILKSSGYEWPLVSGVLLGEKGKYAYKALGSNAVKMWRGLLAADYADMNEGTQRRMKSRAAVALETSGAVSGTEVAQYKAKDEGKFARYSRQEKVNFGLGALDILVIVVTLPLLVKGVAQGSVKVVSKLRNFGQFSARMARNGAQSLRTVPGKVATGVREVKAAAGKVVTKVKETPARVRAAAAERKAAVAAQESAAARRAEEAAAELAQAEREVARELGRMEQSGSINTAKYKPAVVYNALGQARMGWVPAEPVNAAKPSLWKNFLEGSKSWGSNFAYEAGQAFGDMGRALKRQTGFAVMALGMNLTPLPGTALQGLARAESALGNVVRTEQVMTAAPVMAAGKTAPFVVGSLDAVRSVSPTVNNVVKASMLPGVPVSAAGSSVPWSASLMFPAVAVTPTEERRLGLGNFFKFKVGKPQFLNNYLNELNKYERDLALNGQTAAEPVQAAEEASHTVQNGAVIAEEQQGWQRFFPQGVFDAAAFEAALLPRLAGTSGVLSMNGLGAWTDKQNNRRLAKKISTVVKNAYTLAVAQSKDKGRSFLSAFAHNISSGLKVSLSVGNMGELQLHVFHTLGIPGNIMENQAAPNPFSTEEIFDFNAGNPSPVGGFRLTYVDPVSGKEDILPVSLSIDSRIKTEGYNRITFNENFHAQLRNGTQEPKTMSHFFMKFTGTPEQWKQFVELTKQAALPEPLQIKLQRFPNRAAKTVRVPLYDASGREKLPIEVELEKKLLPGEARLALSTSGEIGVMRPFSEEIIPVEGAYIRLPKHQIKNLVAILKNSATVFPVEVLPTKNKAAILYRNQQIYNNSLGKTMGPIIHQDLGMSSASATSLMMVINYVIPGLASFLNPLLRRMGEKRLSVIAGIMTSLSNFMPPLVGFYGIAHEHAVGKVVAGVIITAFILRSAASVLQQVTSNMLVAANNGKIRKAAKKLSIQHKEASSAEAEKKVSWTDVKARIKEVWAHSSSNEDIRNLLMYNLSFVYKNMGTLMFLALPWLINKAVYLVSGYDAQFVYSISFPIFGLYALFVTLQTLHTNLRDAYSVPSVDEAQKAARNTVAEIAEAIRDALRDPQTTRQELVDFLEISGKKLQESTNTVMEAYRKSGVQKGQLAAYRSRTLAELEAALTEQLGRLLPGEQSVSVSKEFSQTLHRLEKNPVTPWQVFLHAPSVALITLGMTLATVHEFTISSAFAMHLNQLIPNGDTANLLVAVALYVPLILGRLGGNLVASRISSGTMYILCNTLSGLGTLIMLGSAGHAGLSILGAAITSLGVGNYFSQMYDYVTKKNPKLQREISVILAITMALAGLLTMPASHLNEWFNGTNLDLLYAAAMLVGSWALTTGMMSNSTLIKFGRSLWKRFKDSLHKNGRHGGEQNGNGPASGPDMNNPLPN